MPLVLFLSLGLLGSFGFERQIAEHLSGAGAGREYVAGVLDGVSTFHVSLALSGWAHEAEDLRARVEDVLRGRGLSLASANDDAPTLNIAAWISDDCTVIVSIWISEVAELLRSLPGRDKRSAQATTWVGPGSYGRYLGTDDCWPLVRRIVERRVMETADAILDVPREPD